MELRREEKPPDHRVAMGCVVEGHQLPPGGDNPGNPAPPSWALQETPSFIL